MFWLSPPMRTALLLALFSLSASAATYEMADLKKERTYEPPEPGDALESVLPG